MSHYMLEVPHTREECLPLADTLLARGQEALAQFSWGCPSGDHIAYALVEAESRGAARALLPASVRNQARVVQVSTLTPAFVAALHARD